MSRSPHFHIVFIQGMHWVFWKFLSFVFLSNWISDCFLMPSYFPLSLHPVYDNTKFHQSLLFTLRIFQHAFFYIEKLSSRTLEFSYKHFYFFLYFSNIYFTPRYVRGDWAPRNIFACGKKEVLASQSFDWLKLKHIMT